MSKRNEQLLIADILESIGKIQRYLKDMSYETFVNDEKTIDAVVRNFEIIGEAANQMPKTFTKRYPAIPWRDLSDFRNVLIHAYFGVDLQMVWQIFELDLDTLKEQIITLEKQEWKKA
ncbi:DUF86 domain-containing protein [Candidatus Albibeggiatoa sp. nov. BB20]|uniref:HepT-like ribonuclease domain-containing protein n=1 Tax=Candidatus Albibeggiatoa sp. nov. BB20 TaxID=3162723 RepID=UPI0033653ECB